MFFKFSLLILIVVHLAQCDPSHNIHSGHHHHQHSHKQNPTDSLFDSNEAENVDANVLLGGKDHVKEYNNLPPEEAKKYVENLLNKHKVDANGDGSIDFGELLAWVDYAFKKIAKDEATEMFDEEDKNKDNLVTWDEHYDSSFNLEEFNEEEMKAIQTEDLELWNAADSNNDGKLNKEEFEMFVAPEDHKQMIPAMYKLVMNRKDVNKDGKLTFDEFVRNENGEMPDVKSETFLSEKHRFEKDLDLNGDGVLKGEEIEKWVAPSDDEGSLTEAEHLMDLCDDNKDKMLNLDELARHISDLASSELTNYGDHFADMDHDEL